MTMLTGIFEIGNQLRKVNQVAAINAELAKITIVSFNVSEDDGTEVFNGLSLRELAMYATGLQYVIVGDEMFTPADNEEVDLGTTNETI